MEFQKKLVWKCQVQMLSLLTIERKNEPKIANAETEET